MRLLAGFFLECIQGISWDLRLVLDALKIPPFEPVKDIDLKYLFFKAVFLFVFASGRRRNKIDFYRESDSIS